MPKFKAEIHGAPCIFDNFYRASIESAIKIARKNLDETAPVQERKDWHDKIIIKVYEGEVFDVPNFSRGKQTRYTLVHEEKYKKD